MMANENEMHCSVANDKIKPVHLSHRVVKNKMLTLLRNFLKKILQITFSKRKYTKLVGR